MGRGTSDQSAKVFSTKISCFFHQFEKVFSLKTFLLYGTCMAICIIRFTVYFLQVFPGTLHPHNYPDPDNPGRLLGRSEVERRTDYIQPLREQLGEQHPLLQLVCQCLHNTPDQRPSAEELLQQLEAARPQVDRTYGSKHVKVEIAKLQVTMMSVLRTRETEVGEKDNEIEHLRHDLQQVQVRPLSV